MVTATILRRWSAWGAASLGLVACIPVCIPACNSVLGIEQASLDPDAATSSDLSCDNYCDAIQKNCTQANGNAEYQTRPVCMAMCGHFDFGVLGEQKGNSLACRMYHTAAAASDPNTHCRHAGPLGDEVCGSRCDAFCLLKVALCKPPNPSAYIDEGSCQTACKSGLTYAPAQIELPSDGNTLNCRLDHLEAAYAQGADLHCPHTAIVSSVCK